MGDHSLRQKSVRQITKDDKKISGKSLCLKYFVKNGIFAFFYLWAPRPVGATKMLGDERADWGMVRF